MSPLQTILGDIPLAAYDFILNGKPGADWIMERQAVTMTRTAAFLTTPAFGPS